MPPGDDVVWRLPASVRSADLRLGRWPSFRDLSPAATARLRRIVDRTPEAMVKLTGRCRSADRLKAHLDYITRNARLQAHAQDGGIIANRADLRALHEDWLLANAASARAPARPDATQSVALILSMPPGTAADRVEQAARTWAHDTFDGRFDWLLVRHDDTAHPHVHVTVRAVGHDGYRLAPGPADLQQWRERFARELRRLGVPAEATPRQARGHVRKTPGAKVYRAEQRGTDLAVRRRERTDAARDASAATPPPPHDWSRDIQARQEAIRRAYQDHARALADGSAAERQLSRDIIRFVNDMPVPLTRRQALAVELGNMRDQAQGRATPERIGTALRAVPPDIVESLPAQEMAGDQPPRTRPVR